MLCNSLLESIFNSPLYPTHPHVPQDMYTIDESIPQTVRSYLQCMAKVTGILLYSSVVTPFFIVGLIPICAFYFVAQRYYIKV